MAGAVAGYSVLRVTGYDVLMTDHLVKEQA
jgi:hypothetical protein